MWMHRRALRAKARRCLAPALAAALAGLLAGGRPAHAQAACAGAFSDSLVQRELRGLERASAVAPLWRDYSLRHHPVVLVADSTLPAPAGTVCAAVWRAGEPLVPLTLTRRPAMATPLYGMISLQEPTAAATNPGLVSALQRVDGADSAALARQGVARGVVLVVPLRFERLGALGEMLARANADPVRIQTEMAVHESFHLQVQFPVWLGLEPAGYPWPSWDVQPDRNAIRATCYAGAPEVLDALRSEQDALVRAFDAAAARAPQDSTAELARHFVALRLARYALIDSLHREPGATAVACEAGEDLMELEEGLVQWVGHATLVEAGLTTLAQLRSSYIAEQAERFYQLAPLQLWVLKALHPEADPSAHFDAISNARAPHSIFAELRSLLR